MRVPGSHSLNNFGLALMCFNSAYTATCYCKILLPKRNLMARPDLLELAAPNELLVFYLP
jgi:hypothetical protein